MYKNVVYSPFRDNSSKGAFRHIFTVALLLFLAPVGGSNPERQSPNLTQINYQNILWKYDETPHKMRRHERDYTQMALLNFKYIIEKCLVFNSWRIKLCGSYFCVGGMLSYAVIHAI